MALSTKAFSLVKVPVSCSLVVELSVRFAEVTRSFLLSVIIILA